ncbi:MAG: transposase, partial [Myxococcota bacterium]
MTKGNKRQPKSKNAPKRRRGAGQRRKKNARRQIVLPGQIVFLTARVSHRRYLLKPTRMTKEAFRYLLAHYATKWNIDIIAICVMSNHWHIMIRDNDGKRPKFLADLNRTLAQHIKTTYSTRGNIFRPKPNQVVCLHPEAIVDKIAYTLANPVS